MPEVIKDKVEESTEETEEVSEETEEESKEEEGKKEDKKEEEGEEDEEDELEEAKSLVKIFKNPDKFKAFVAASAKELGILTDGAPAKKDIKDYTALLESRLGEYKFLAKGLGEAIKEIIETEVTEVKRETDTKLAVAERARIESGLAKAWENLSEELTDLDKYQRRIADVSKRYHYDSTETFEDYLRDLYHLAKTRKAQASMILEKKVSKINKNARTAGIPGETDESKVRKGSAFPTAAEAVRAALEGRRI